MDSAEIVARCRSAANDLDNMPKNHEARALRFDYGAWGLREAADHIEELLEMVKQANEARDDYAGRYAERCGDQMKAQAQLEQARIEGIRMGLEAAARKATKTAEACAVGYMGAELKWKIADWCAASYSLAEEIGKLDLKAILKDSTNGR